jgi:hypothetical protein
MALDPLDQEDYNPIDHLNGLFKNPSNLSRLPELEEHTRLYSAYLDCQLSKPVELSEEELKSVKRVEDAPEEIDALIKEMGELKVRAEASEKTITDMTYDIKRLDNTKANLVQTITVLKRLQMLTTAYDQLEGVVKKRQYKEMAQTLPAVLELMSHFKSFRSISQIAMLSRRIGEIQTQISDQIFKDFSLVVEGTNKAEASQQQFNDIATGLADACTVLDSLPGNHREQLITWYCNVQLREYRSIFKNNDEAGSLDNISRRYAYLKRLLKRHNEEYSRYFSANWNVVEALCNSFCMTTREDISVLLKQAGRGINVQLLLQALEETLEFEAFLEKRFATTKNKEPKYEKIISIAFQPHLNLWIEHQDKILSNKFNQYKAPPRPSQENQDVAGEMSTSESEPTVLPSSADLFIFYRQVFTQTAKLSTGPPLLDLCNLFGKWLGIYCQQVLSRVVPNRLSSLDDVKSVCMVLNTADYCFTTTTQLEQKIIDMLDAELKEKVDLEREKNQFLELISSSITSLVNKVLMACEGSWREMVNTNWSRLEVVGDQSSYVSELRRCVEEETTTILDYIQKELYCRMVCDKTVEAVTSEFLQRVVYCRPISEVAAEQMLLDLYVLKGSFLKLPLLKPQHGEVSSPKEVSNAYSRHVTKSLGRVETILKVILTQTDPAEGLVQNYFYLVGDSSTNNFSKILDLKGVSRGNQTRLIELFNSHLKAHDDLTLESPILTNLRIQNQSSHTRVPSSTFSSPVEPPKVLGSSILSKENLEKGFERFTHGPEGPVVNKLNENFRNIGRLFRRDGSGHNSPKGR